MKSKQIILISASSVGAIVFAAAGFLLLRGLATFRDALDTFTAEKQALGAYYEKDPFPSQTNIAREQDNGRIVNGWYEKILARLVAQNVVSSEYSPSKFRTNYDEAKKRLLDTARDSNVQVAGDADFAFGFDRYSNTGNLPDEANVPALTEQLIIVERLCDVLFAKGIKVLAAVRRDDIEAARGVPAGGGPGHGTAAGAGVTAPPGRRQRPSGSSPRPPSRPPKSARAGAGPSLARPVGKLYNKLHFGLDFKAKQGALLGVLNALSSNDMFVVVASVSMEKAVPEMMPVGLEAPPGTGPDDLIPTLPPAFGGPDVKPDVSAVAVIQPWEKGKVDRIVSGPEHELPMDITVELDVYKFQPESNRGE